MDINDVITCIPETLKNDIKDKQNLLVCIRTNLLVSIFNVGSTEVSSASSGPAIAGGAPNFNVSTPPGSGFNASEAGAADPSADLKLILTPCLNVGSTE
eukprot:COSAG01_NODE_7_length_54400_cov_1218.054935_2_plen_99_part_00